MNLINNKNVKNELFPVVPEAPDKDEELAISKSQEKKDEDYLSRFTDGFGGVGGNISPEVYHDAVSDVAGVKSRLQGYKSEMRDPGQAGENFRRSVKDMMSPKLTPEHRLQQYSRSDAALESALDGAFTQEVESRFRKKREASQNAGNDVYMRNASVVGGNPEMAMLRALEVDNPVKDIESTIAETDYSGLAERLAPIARHGGYDMDEYLRERVVPEMYDRLLDEVINDEVPRSSAEYVFRSALHNSLIGKAATYANNNLLGDNTHSLIQNDALGRYKPGFFEEVFSGVGSLLVDSPVFSALGGLGHTAMRGFTDLLTKRLSTKILATKFADGMTRVTADRIAKNLITRSLSNKIIESAGVQGLTLGSYDALNSVVDDMLYQNDVNVGKAARSFGKGLLTGAALGIVGTPLRESAKGLTGMKKMLASSGVLCAESAVFTAGTELEKMKAGIEIAPIDLMRDFSQSTATLLIMRMAHWRPSGAKMKLDAQGKLKKEFNLSSSERAELMELDVNPEQFLKAIETELHLPSFGGEKARFIKDAYSRLMSSDKLSASTKSKLLFLVESKITSTPPIPFEYTVRQRDDSRWEITTYDSAGRVVVRESFEHAGNAKSYMIVHRGELRRNRIVLFETELTDGMRSMNFLRQAGEYAKEKGRNIDEISDAIYKNAKGEEMTPQEKKIVDDIVERASYDEAGMVQWLYDARRRIERKYGLEEGSMLLAIKESFYRISDAQNAALDEYEALVRGEVERLEGGASKRRAVRMLKQGLNSEYFGMTNDEVKDREIEDYFNWVAVRDADRVGLRQVSHPATPVRPIYIPPEDNSGFVWSYGPAKNTKEDLVMYKERADKIAGMFGVKLNYIFDEREIARPDPDDIPAVIEYNRQVTSPGWMNNGKIILNLPNAQNIREVEKTVLHEIVAHKGLMHIFGEHLNDFFEDIYKKASPEVLRGISRIKHRYNYVDNYTLIEEYLAYLAESVSLTPQERSLYVKVKDYIRGLLIKMHIYTGNNRQISEAELTRIMQRHCEYLLKNAGHSEHLNDVFGDFKSAHFDRNTYRNRAEYYKGVKSQIEKGKFFSSTPRFFRNDKELLYYDYLPADMQKNVRDRYGFSEEDMKRLSDNEHYRINESAGEWYVPGEEVPLNDKNGYGYAGPSYGRIGEKADGQSYEVPGNTGIDDAPLVIGGYGTDRQYRMPVGRNQGGGIRYRMPEGSRKKNVWDEMLQELESETGNNTHDGESVPVLKDAFYRSLKVNSPTYAYVYEHLRNLPPEKWGSYDHSLWNTLVDMAEGGAGKFVLKDIVTDRQFLEDYPELAMVPVKISKELPSPAMYDRENNRILLDGRVYLYPQSKFYIDGVLRSVARDYEERRNSVSRQLDEFNVSFKKKYADAVDYANKLGKMHELIPDFDADNSIAESYRNEYGFYPDEFLARFPEIDDYLLFRVTRGMGGMLNENLSPEQREAKQGIIDKKISRHRKFFWGPVEIIIDAANSSSDEGPLRVATRKDHERDVLPSSNLDMSERYADYLKYYPKVKEFQDQFRLKLETDPTGLKEYDRIKKEKMRKEMEKKKREKELERERRRLEMN